MKRPLQLPLAITLALSATNALALGLGPVHVNSKLNQPLDAEIPVIQGTQGEAEGLLASLASAEDFERVGLNRSRLTVPLDFAVTKNARGEVFIRITSKEPVRDAFIDVLVEANWPKGRLLREYAILLDPPVSAPATTRSTAAAPGPGSPGSVTLVKREPRPDRPASAPAAPRAPKPAAAAESRKASGGEYGPIEAGETLSAIARTESAGAGVTHNQMMLALLKHNPDAFYRNNINALKRGAILRIPSAAEAKAIGSASEAAALAQAQIEDWRGGRASPTLVADAGGKPAAPAAAAEKPKAPSTATAAAKGASERLELVPPKAGKDSLAMADRPGSGGGSAALTELKAELSRTKEALTARDQETGELKSRVRELEDLKGKNDRLINLKDSEIAELQRKLKEMQDASAKGGAAKPATATEPGKNVEAAKGEAGKGAPSKDEIWGNATPAAKPASDAGKPADEAAKPASGTAAVAPAAAPPATTPSSTTPAPAPTAASPAAPTGEAGQPAPTAGAATAPSTPPASTPAAPAAVAPTPPATTATPPASAPKTAAATAPKTDAKARPKPAPVAARPWYEEPWVLPAAAGGGVLALLLGLFGLRKRKPAPAPERGSIASAFGDSPLPPAPDAEAADASYDTEEVNLREQIARDPSNLGLRLELLSIHYAERATAKFEAAAAEMHAYVSDPQQPEWQEAVAMGQEMAPHNPLFAAPQRDPAADDDEFARGDFAPSTPAAGFAPPARAFEDFTGDLEPAQERAEPNARAESPLGFGLDGEFEHREPADSTAKLDGGFEFDLPPLDFEPPAKPEPETETETPLEDDYFGGEDVVGTKLDLAKAYMDMGDPEGARSMLDEVIAEGSDAQKAEAQRLLVELR